MLGFGVVVGSLVSGSEASVLQPLLVAVAPSTNGAAPAANGVGGSGGSGDGGGTRTITTTTPAPSTSIPASNASPSTPSTTPTTPTSSNLPPIKHVFMIVLSGQGFSQTLGHTSADPYLAKTLADKGAVIDDYYAVAGGPLANEIALISGQGPTPQTVDNCPKYKNVVPGVADTNGQVLGTGCVYPKTTETLADQLTSAHLTWKAYVQTAGAQKQARPEMCQPKLGSSAAAPTATTPYATWRNPFLYFRSVIGTSTCPKSTVGLGQLVTDLKTDTTTPALSYIVPDVCNDGDSAPCAAGSPSGMIAADAFLKTVVPKIEQSPAYKASGMIVITFDGAPQTGQYADSSSCCNNPTYPNDPSASSPTGSTGPTGASGAGGATGATGAAAPTLIGGGATSPTGGGGQVGLLLMSRYVKPGTPDLTDYFNHFSLLASIEQLFGLTRLGYASDPQLPLFGAAVYDNYSG